MTGAYSSRARQGLLDRGLLFKLESVAIYSAQSFGTT